MKLKKILAIALAATTAITMVPNVALAKTSYGSNSWLDKDETITITQGNKTNNNYVDYVFKVTKPIYNNGNSKSTNADKAKSNAVYSNGGLSNTTTSGEVTLAAINVGSSFNGTVTIPGYVVGASSLATLSVSSDGSISTLPTGSVEGKFAMATGGTIDGAGNNDGYYIVKKVELDGSAIENSEKITTVNVSGDAATTLSKLQLDNFEKLTTLGAGAISATELSLKNTKLDLGRIIKPIVEASSLKKLNIAELIADKTVSPAINSDVAADRVELDLTTVMPNAELVNVHGNNNIKTLKVTIGAFTPVSTGNATADDATNAGLAWTGALKNCDIDIEDASNIVDLELNNAGFNALATRGLSAYNVPSLGGFTFISGGEKTKTLDLSSNASMGKVEVKGAGITSFTAPSINKDMTSLGCSIDVSNNALTTANLSNASDALTVNLAYNKLMDVDVSGLSKVTVLNVSNNYLTSLNITDCEMLTASCTTDGNYIPKDNFDKDSSKQTGISLGTQAEPNVYKFSYTGDLGQGLNADTKATIKLAGSGNLNFGVLVAGAPDGFAEKLAETVDFDDANKNETSAVTLGEKQILMATEKGYNSLGYGSGNQTLILATVPVTGNAEKKGADKITAKVGNTSKSININTDNVALVSYDIASAIPADTYTKANEDNLSLAQFYYPTTAYVLGSNGTVNATIQNEKPVTAKSDDTWSGDIKAYHMKGLTFTKWNTAADGTGTAIAAGGKIQNLAEDTTLYGQYTENTYSIKYEKSYYGTGVDTINGSTTTQSKLTYGEEVTLNSNGYSTKKGNFYGWKEANGNTFYGDGQAVQGLAADQKKSDDITMTAIFGDVDHYTDVDSAKSSVELVVGDPFKGTLSVDDLDAVVTGAPTGTDANDQLSVDLGYDENATYYDYLSSDTGVVEYAPTVAGIGAGVANEFVAKGPGTANIYVIDKQYKNVATVTVTVKGKAEAASDAEAKAKAAAVNKAIAAGDKTDVTAYSKIVDEVQLNKDGDNTVTVTVGNKTAKTVNLANKLVIGDKEYTITQVEANAYKGAKLTTLKTGNSLKKIGAKAFANAKKMKKLGLGKKVNEIGAKAFYNTVNLKTVSVASKYLTKTTKVGAKAFTKSGSKVKTKVNFTKTLTKKQARSTRKVLKKRGLKTYGKKTTSYTYKSKKF